MKKMILSAVMLVFAASGYAQETGAAGAGERNEWLPTFEAVAVDADLDVKFVRVPDTEAPKIVYDTKGSYTTKFRAEVKDKTLRISEKPDSRRPERTEVTVYYNTLRAVSLSGAAATFVGTLDAAVLDVTVNRKASLTAKLDVKDLKMEQTGYSSGEPFGFGALPDVVCIDGQGGRIRSGGDVGRGQCPEQGRGVVVDHRPFRGQDDDQCADQLQGRS